MSMEETIRKTGKQFGFKPRIMNEESLGNYWGYVTVGMGGSILAAKLLKMWKPGLDMILHQNYGLPELPKPELTKRLIILSSYSGNTEEVLDAYEKAGEIGLNRIVISIGGKLLEMVKRDKTAYVQMPDLQIQPRSALPLSLLSFLKIINEKKMLSDIGLLEDKYRPGNFEPAGKKLAGKMAGRIPVIYTSEQNITLGYVWKITFNETGKIPAFCNVFPELNHNEMNGYDVFKLADKFCFLFLEDTDDSLKIKKRMEVTAKMYKDRKLMVETIKLDNKNKYLKFFDSVAVAEFAACELAKGNGMEAEKVPMVEELKKKI